jgi:glycosyltransferase involved in cell wall biosynthesis/predicted Zn-dependent protease/predicted O-methyltransferase YrrM
VPLSYLFGPADRSFPTRKLPQACADGTCIPFSLEQVQSAGSWQAFTEAVLKGSTPPDFLVLDLPYQCLPPWLLSAPLPVVGLVGDGSLLWHGVRRLSLDLILCDEPTAEHFRQQGIEHVRPAILYGIERAFVETGPLDGDRPIDILFVGNLHPWIHRARSPWLARLAKLGERWKVHITSGPRHDDYRALLRQSKVVFNRSIRSEWNRRNGEAIGSKCLLFCEADNREVPELLRDGIECVYYDENTLESLLEEYLIHEEKRRTIVEAAHAHVEELTFEAFWNRALSIIEEEWPAIQERARLRQTATPMAVYSLPGLLSRTWQALSSAGDPALHEGLLQALGREPNNAELHNALGLAAAIVGPHGRITGEVARQACEHFRAALLAEPRHLVAGLNLVEALTGLGNKPQAVEAARQLLRPVDAGAGDDATLLDAPRFPPCFDLFRVEWERCAWDHAGDPSAEATAKRKLIQWRLHWLLAELTGDIGHLHEAVQIRPDFPLSQAALGCALGRSRSLHLAIPHLRRALAGAPLDQEAARSLYQALRDTGDPEGAKALARDYRLLHQAAPVAIKEEPWFQEAPRSTFNLKTITRAELEQTFGQLDTSRALCGFTLAHDTHVVLTLLAHLQPKRVLEIGTAAGHMTANLTEWSPEDATVFTIGITSDMQGACKPPQQVEAPPREALGHFNNHFGKGNKVFSITADSSTYDFRRISPIDFAFIDGAHDLEHVLADTLNVYRELSPGGCIVWHDFNSKTEWVQVRQALEQARLPEPIFHVEGTEVAFLLKQGSEVRGQKSEVRSQQAGTRDQPSPLTSDLRPLTSGLSVSWEGAFSGLHSLSLVNRELCQRLAGREIDLQLVPREFPRQLGVPELPLPDKLARLMHGGNGKPADIHVGHQWPPDFQPPASGHWVIMQPWEYGSLPRAWLEPFANQVDEVWVPTQYVKKGFVASGVPADRVAVVPLGVDVKIFHPEAQRLRLKTKQKFRFLFVGGTIWRKGIDVLLKAYARAFTCADDVCLVIKEMGKGTFYKDQTADKLLAEIQRADFAPEIEYIDQPFDNQQLAGLYTACDCLVHPYRGEGFGLPIAEAMACGLPVIVTGQGAALDFCNESNAYLLPAKRMYFPEKKIGNDETVDYPWASEPDRDALVQLLRHVKAHPDEACKKGVAGCAHIRQYFTWDHAAAVVQERLQEVSRRPVFRHTPRSALRPLRMTVSLTMIVRNEEQNLAACLRCIIDLVDEVIIIDTGSTDRTKEIAASFGPKVKIFDFPWVKDFSAARNAALEKATSHYILWMDADDRLDEPNRQRLKQLFENLRDENVAYTLKCFCPADAQGRGRTTVDHVRLFRNRDDIRWRYRVHEQILGSLRATRAEVRWGNVVFLHTGYQDPALRARKLQRDRELLHLSHQEDPNEPFVLFNLGMVYQEMGRQEEALVYLCKSLERSHPTDSIVRKLFALIASSLRLLGRMKDALAVCREGLGTVPDDAELLFRQGELERDLGNLPAAEASFRQLLGTRPDPHFASVDPDLRSWRGRHELARVLFMQGKHADALPLAREVVREQPESIPGWLLLGQLGLDSGNLALTEEAATALTQIAGGQQEAESFRVQILLARGEFSPARARAEEMVSALPDDVRWRQLLAQVLLTAGDLPAAEEALRQVVRLNPCDQQAQAALSSLLRRRMRSENDVFSALGDVNVWALEEHFKTACLGPSEVHEHLPTLRDLARECKAVTEIGSPSAGTTLAFLLAEPRRLVRLDMARRADEGTLRALAGSAELVFQVTDLTQAQPAETDLLFVGMGPGLELSNGFLERHAARARKLVVVHGTADGNGRGQAVEALLAGGQFHLRQRHENNNGLTVLERIVPAGQARDLRTTEMAEAELRSNEHGNLTGTFRKVELP